MSAPAAAVHIGVGSEEPVLAAVERHLKSTLEKAALESRLASLAALAQTFDEFVAMCANDALRLCERIGIARAAQETKLGGPATVEGVKDALSRAARSLIPGGVLVVSFAGHGMGGSGPEGWWLSDRFVSEVEVQQWLGALPNHPACTVIADHCFGFGALASVSPPMRGASPPPSLVLFSAVDETQERMNARTSFAAIIEAAWGGQPRPRTVRGLLERIRGRSRRATASCVPAELWDRTPFYLQPSS